MPSLPKKTHEGSSSPSILILKIPTTPLQHTLLKWNGKVLSSGTINNLEAMNL